MESVFAQFLKDKTYIGNVSPKTISFYQQSFSAFRRYYKGELKDATKADLNNFVIALRERGMSPNGANVYIRGMNSFFSWCFANEVLREKLVIPKLKKEKKIVKTFTEAQLKAIVYFKPKGFFEHRIHTLLCLLIDIGIRINEALTLTRERVDLDNMLLKVKGKGNKERIVPFSPDMRKHLARFLKMHHYNYVFPTEVGGSVEYQCARTYMVKLCKRLGIEGVRTSPHTLRHTFALEYLRSGGNLVWLQHVMGHEDITTTRMYLNLATEDLQIEHAKTSLLSRLR